MPPRVNAPYPNSPTETHCRCAPNAAERDGELPIADDWHTLLLAVRTRLHDVLDAWPVLTDTPEQRDAAVRSRALALDCAEALDQLHDALVDEARRHRRRAVDLQEARAELARREAQT